VTAGEATAARARARAPRGQGDRLREEILAATERLLARTGDEDAVSIRAICDQVGVTAPSIYLHFADKEALLLEVCRRDFAAFDDAVEAAGAAIADPVDALRRRGRAYVAFGLDHPEQYRVLFMSHRRSRHVDGEAVGRSAFEHLVAAVARCVAAGAFRPVDPRDAAVTIWSALHGVTSLLIARPELPWPDSMIDDACDAQLRAYANEPGGR
jgi:AcrR family transcriptional regulator